MLHAVGHEHPCAAVQAAAHSTRQLASYIHFIGHWPDLNTCQLRLAVAGLFDKLLIMEATAAEGAASMLNVLLPCQRSWLVCLPICLHCRTVVQPMCLGLRMATKTSMMGQAAKMWWGLSSQGATVRAVLWQLPVSSGSSPGGR